MYTRVHWPFAGADLSLHGTVALACEPGLISKQTALSTRLRAHTRINIAAHQHAHNEQEGYEKNCSQSLQTRPSATVCPFVFLRRDHSASSSHAKQKQQMIPVGTCFSFSSAPVTTADGDPATEAETHFGLSLETRRPTDLAPHPYTHTAPTNLPTCPLASHGGAGLRNGVVVCIGIVHWP